jgi:hypothetical protein
MKSSPSKNKTKGLMLFVSATNQISCGFLSVPRHRYLRIYAGSTLGG